MALDAAVDSLLPCLTRIQSGGWKTEPNPSDNCQPLMVGLMPKLLNTLNHSERNTMYYIFMTIASVAFIIGGATNVDGGYLWIAMLVIGGIYLGHVMTEALNEK
jgi:hypothetical protein